MGYRAKKELFGLEVIVHLTIIVRLRFEYCGMMADVERCQDFLRSPWNFPKITRISRQNASSRKASSTLMSIRLGPSASGILIRNDPADTHAVLAPPPPLIATV